MANTQSTEKQSGLTRGKAILIGVLAVVLLGVLYLQFGRGDAAASSEPSAYIPRRAPAVDSAISSPASEVAETSAQAASNRVTAVATVVDGSRWKSPDLADVVDYDPFALPETFPKPQTVDAGANREDLVAAAAADDARKLADAILQLKSDLQSLQQVGVQVIVREGNQYVAMIGDRTLHVGEEIKGFTVTRIDPDGVIVERKSSE